MSKVRLTLATNPQASWLVLLRASKLLNFSKTLYTTSADWEVRRDATGRDVYYDHDNKVVRLDRPDQGTGQSGFCLVCHGTCTMHKFI